MFDVGILELLVIGVVALIVVGPERLPGLARSAGLWIGKARQMVGEIRNEVERELRVEELRDSIQHKDTSDELKRLAERVKDINSELHQPIERKVDTDRVATTQNRAEDGASPGVTPTPAAKPSAE